MVLRGRYPAVALVLLAGPADGQPDKADPLPSWNDTAPKKVITAFVAKVTKDGSPDFVPPAERIAVFDNDGIRFATTHCTKFDKIALVGDKAWTWLQQN